MDFNPEMTEYRLWLRHIPTDLIGRYGVLIGDIAHNLRSALDHLAWELVRIGSDRQPRMPRMVQFPCCDTPGEFRAELGKRLPGVGAEYIAAIEDLQPYKRGKLPQFIQRGAPLKRLVEISNKDKHQVLIPVLAVGEYLPWMKFKRDVQLLDRLVNDGPLEVGADIVRCFVQVMGPNPQVEVQGKPSFQIAFEDGRAVAIVLTEIGSEVHRAITVTETIGESLL